MLWSGQSDFERRLTTLHNYFQVTPMGDLIFAFAMIAFFVITARYIIALDRI